MLRRLGVCNARSRKLMYDSWYIAYEYLNTPGLSYCSRMYNIIWERCIHGMHRQHHRYGHKLYESYGVFCNQFEVINIIFFENVTTFVSNTKPVEPDFVRICPPRLEKGRPKWRSIEELRWYVVQCLDIILKLRINRDFPLEHLLKVIPNLKCDTSCTQNNIK